LSPPQTIVRDKAKSLQTELDSMTETFQAKEASLLETNSAKDKPRKKFVKVDKSLQDTINNTREKKYKRLRRNVRK
jgi:predicted  nucleic acid-binding Zn-ribbon protein